MNRKLSEYLINTKVMYTMNYRLLVSFFLIAITFKTNAQVNLQTGSAVFSLPLFDWQDHKSRLNLGVALSYNSGNGLKVSEVASNVGQGWSLVAGGVITRMQVGEPDDQIGWGGSNGLNKFPPGYLHASIPAYLGCPTALTQYPLYTARNQLYAQRNEIAEDKQLDYFTFQFNGKSGLFILDKASGNKGILLGDSKIKITFQEDVNLKLQGIRTTIKSFTIQDVDGLIYTFSQHGIAKVLESSYCDESLNYEQRQPEFESGKVYHQIGFESGALDYPKVIGSWYLKEVKDPFTGRLITFNYTTRDINQLAGQDITYNSSGNYSIISYKRSIAQSPQLDSINYPDKHTVIFDYGKEREDFKGQSALASVRVNYYGRPLSQYLLNTTYFILNRYGTPVTDYQKSVARLCLRSVQKIGVDLKEDSPPYTFDYYLGSSQTDDVVPPPFHYAKDIWGYYNGDESKSFGGGVIDLTKPVNQLQNNDLRGLCFMRNNISGVVLNPKMGYAKNGLLKQIIYPTGGTLEYKYEQNYGLLDSYRAVGGVHVSATQSTDGGYSNNCDNPLVTNYQYVLNQAGAPSSLWGLEMPVNALQTTSDYKPETQRYKWGLTNCGIFGCCYYKYMYPGIMSQQQVIDLTKWQNTMETLAPVFGAMSIVSTIMDIATVLTVTPTPLSIAAVVIDVIVGIITLVDTCTRDLSKSTTTTIYYNTDLNAASPLPAQFKRVEVVENLGTTGKTVHEFTSDVEYGIWHLTNPAFSARQRFGPWLYGLPKSTLVVNAAGQKVKETIYEYTDVYKTKVLINPYDIHNVDTANKTDIYSDLISCKCLVTYNNSQKSSDWNDPTVYNAPSSYKLVTDPGKLSVELNGYYTGHLFLQAIYERTFKESDPTQFLEVQTRYNYNTDRNYEVSSITTQLSNGDWNTKSIKYTSDYTGGVINKLLQNNVVALPVATYTSIGKSGSGSGFLDLNVTEFTELPSGDIKPSRILELRDSRPFNFTWLGGEWNDYEGPVNTNYSKFKEVQTFAYDGSGNLIGLKDEGARVVTNIYDHDDKFITASVVNADPATDKCAYTSFETTSLGGWSASTLVYTRSPSSVTGTRSLVLNSSTSITASFLNTMKPYRLSFWASNASVTVSGSAVLIVASPTINGFTYYEYDLPPGTSSVTLSGNANIDEVRLYPKMARMRTVTYDPLIGKTAECDENNRITYYEYDNLGRLRFIKDDSRNVVKMYEYNNVSKQTGCPTIFYNNLVREKFTKNTCGPDYVGTAVEYTVPANKYSSTISQEDADAKAQSELLELGQNNANTSSLGVCQPIYSNDEKTFTQVSESCSIGYVGGSVTYTVPAGRYTSLLSKDDANDKAQRDINANGWAYVNNPANSNCTYSTDPFWSWESGISQCRYVDGQAHKFIQETDLNPNSSSYGGTRWADIGPTTATSDCITPTCTNCNQVWQKCINGSCDTGFRVNTQSYWDTSMGQYVCVYHYEWMDGTTSQDYYDYSGAQCPLN